MAQKCRNDECHLNQKYRDIALSICWFLGLICGMYLFYRTGTPAVSWMRRIVNGSVSILSLFGIYFFPFLFTAYAIWITRPALLYVIAVARAALYAFVSLGVFVAFGSSGWVVQGLVLCCDSVLVFCLYTMWLRVLRGCKSTGAFFVFCVATICLLMSAVDYCVISPFWACLIEN